MKNIKVLAALFISTIMFCAISCDSSCDCPEAGQDMISQYDLNKSIVEVNTTNVSTGIESLFITNLSDSSERAHLCQTFVEAARFYDDESGYFFIETLDDAWVVAHVNTDLIGTSRINIQDEYGNYFIKAMVETVTYTGYGFTEYYRKNPSTEVIERKLSFVTSIPSAGWFIGTGFYGDPPEMYYDYTEAQKTILLEATNTMAKGIGNVLDNIYPEENDGIAFCQNFIDHIRFYDNRSGYFFINTMDGLVIAHGADAELEGKNMIDLQDTHGAYIIKDMTEIVEENGSGYYEYYWDNPATGNESTKITYVRQIPNTDYYIGAGFYLD